MSPGGGGRVVVVNTGSSSLKAASFDIAGDGPRRAVTATVGGIGDGGHATIAIATGEGGEAAIEERAGVDHAAALAVVLEVLAPAGSAAPAAVGHRIVHGGEAAGPELVDTALLDRLERLVPWAPLHLPVGLAAIARVAERWPGVRQVACFDTAFHHDLPLAARRLPLPAALWAAGFRRYGFHGLSYEHVVDHVGAAVLGRAVVAHLGAGASLAAIRDGRPVDTTMGFTPAGGVMMATRSGDLDPGVLLQLLGDGWDAGRLERLVEHESGLLGISGTTGDMAALLDARGRDGDAALAVECFCRDVTKHVGALAALLGGLDTLVFTGGIGEHAAPVREAVCASLGFLGVALDADRNARSEAVISTAAATCRVLVVTADEERVIARQTIAVALRGGATDGDSRPST